MGRLRLLFLLLILAWAASALAQSGVALIVHPSSSVERLSKDEAINLFLGRYRHQSRNQVVEAVDLPVGDPVRERFYSQLTGKEASQIDAYWSRMVFSGAASRPLVMASTEAAIRHVLRNRAAVAYVAADQVDGRVRVVFRLP